MEALSRKKLINKDIYHPFFGHIGAVKNVINHKGIKYIIVKERCTTSVSGESLRAIPVKLVYWHTRSGELRVNFGPQWITEAPTFTTADLDQKNDQVAAMLTEFYRNNTLWSGKIA